MCDCCTNSFQLKCCGNLGDPCATCKTCYNALEGLVNHLLKVAGGVGLFFSFTLVSFLCTNVHSLSFWGTGRYSRFQVTGMVIWGQKTKPKKIPTELTKPLIWVVPWIFRLFWIPRKFPTEIKSPKKILAKFSDQPPPPPPPPKKKKSRN